MVTNASCTGFTTKLSSAGLTYKHYGRRIVAQLMGDLPLSHPDVEVVYLATYKNFMEAIDAIDNGTQLEHFQVLVRRRQAYISQAFPPTFVVPCASNSQQQTEGTAGVNQWEGTQVPKYINNTHLSARVGQLNPNWNEDQSNEVMDAHFARAMELTGSEFRAAVGWHSKVPFQLLLCIALCISAWKGEEVLSAARLLCSLGGPGKQTHML